VDALGALGFALLVSCGVIHVALAVAIARAKPQRGAIALLVPPLSMVWGWDLGAKRRVMAYGGSLALFTLVVAVIQLVR